MTEQQSIEERVARYMAAEDWIEDPADNEWWSSRLAEFRESYLTSARRVISIVHGTDQPALSARPDDTTCPHGCDTSNCPCLECEANDDTGDSR